MLTLDDIGDPLLRIRLKAFQLAAYFEGATDELGD